MLINILKNISLVILTILLQSICIYSQVQTDIAWPTLADSPWPMVKHDPQFTGRTSNIGPKSPHVAWGVLKRDGIFSGPVIGEENNLYVGGYDSRDSQEQFYSYTKEGILRWTFATNSLWPPDAGIIIDSSNTIYFGASDSNFYAVNSDGELKWKCAIHNGVAEMIIPNIDLEGNLYVTDFTGYLYSITPEGSIRWEMMYESGFKRMSPVFSPDGESIYIFGADSNMYSFNREGILNWKFSCNRSLRAPIVDSQGNIYMIESGVPQTLHSIKSNGEINWSVEIFESALPNYSIPTIDYEGNIYFILKDSLYPINQRNLISYSHDGEFRWSFPLDMELYEFDEVYQPLICDREGTVYFGSTYGTYYYAVDKNGNEVWKIPMNGMQVDHTGAIAEDGTLYLGVHGGNTLDHPALLAIKESVTSVEETEIHPEGYTIGQNYPNPFNPMTKIEYEIYEGCYVEIVVYDILGKEVMRPVSEYKSKGSYTIELKAESLSSGTFFYTFYAGGKVMTKKMMVLK